MPAKLNIYDFNTIQEAILESAQAGNLSETSARELIEKVILLRVETLKGAN